jgi:hypothetical protein
MRLRSLLAITVALLAFGDIWPAFAVQSAMSHEMSGTLQRIELFSRSHHALIRVYDESGNVIEKHEQTGDFRDL